MEDIRTELVPARRPAAIGRYLTERALCDLANGPDSRKTRSSTIPGKACFGRASNMERGSRWRSERSYAVDPDKSIFTPGQIAEYEKQAQQLNTRKDGDQAAFYLPGKHDPIMDAMKRQ